MITDYYYETILTKSMLDDMNKLYVKQQKVIQQKLKLILNGNSFGESTTMYPDGYFPSELIEVLDYEQGIIKYREISVDTIRQGSVFWLVVDGYKQEDM